MVADAVLLQPSLEARNEDEGPVFKIKNDPRVTRVGRCLRQTSIDELPQLGNVLSGEMSLVGPRPLPLRDVPRFSAGDDASLQHETRSDVPLAGRGRSTTSFDRWVELDLEYIDRWSLVLDLQILTRTVPTVLQRSRRRLRTHSEGCHDVIAYTVQETA